MKWRVPGQEVDQRKLGERLWKKTVEHVIEYGGCMDHSRWRKQIGMIDDHDECQWVNVSSGTAEQ